jgi:tripartite-type tricarboxylate transporter receptor subunit TctC
MNLRLLFSLIAGAAAALVVQSVPLVADPVADFYRGKTISLYVGFPPGGGYDVYARVMAPHFTRNIPGKPAIVIKTMLGGSGIRAASYMSNVTVQDGTSLGLFLDALTLGKVLGGPGYFDPTKLQWIGRSPSTATVSVVWHTSPVQSVEEAKKHQILVAGTVPTNLSNVIPAALNGLIGTKFKVILGFRGSPDQALAMLRGEVHSIGGMAWEAIQINHPEWLTDKKIRVLYVQAANRVKELPNTPALLDFAYDDRSRRIFAFLGSGPSIGRSLVAEPGAPSERVAALRKAFTATMADPELIADFSKRGLNLDPLSGEAVQQIIAASIATPAELVAQTRSFVGRQ